jgi:hypothetical protein
MNSHQGLGDKEMCIAYKEGCESARPSKSTNLHTPLKSQITLSPDYLWKGYERKYANYKLDQWY